ncbi:MAG: response regulator [Opitutae bacterium]|nr:response regulator [Opitutae bacterium]
MPATERILHVDDDETSRLALHCWMERSGFLVTSAATTAEADRCLDAEKYALILSDIHMPGNMRLEWIERLLAREDAPAVVLLTGNPELETALRAANLPVAAYLLKPPNYALLGQALRRLLDERRHREELADCVRSIRQMLAERGQPGANADGLLPDPLSDLAGKLARAAAPHPRSATTLHGQPLLRQVLTETITTLEKTKGSFRSKELRDLRQRLERVLAGMGEP